MDKNCPSYWDCHDPAVVICDCANRMKETEKVFGRTEIARMNIANYGLEDYAIPELFSK